MEKEIKTGEQLMSVKDLSVVLVKSPQSIYNELSLGKFPIKAVRIGRLVRFRKSDVEKYLKAL